MRRLSIVLLIGALALAQNTANFPGAVPTNGNMGIASNRAQTTLTSGINTTATSIPVLSSTGFKAGSFVTIDSEIIAVCSIPDGSHLNVGVSSCPNVDGRGTDTANGGGAAASHLVNAAVQGRVVAWHLNQATAEIRAIATKLHNEVVSPKDYGALGDGSTDDTTALQAAVNQAQSVGGVLYVPPGTYITTGLTVSNPIVVRCAGSGNSILKMKSGATKTINDTRGNGTPIISVSSTSQVAVSDCGFQDASGYAFGIATNSASDIRIERNNFSGLGETDVSFKLTNKTWVERNRFDTAGLSGVRYEDPGAAAANADGWVVNNYFVNMNTSHTGGFGAIQTYGDASASQSYIRAERNTIDNPGTVAIGFDWADHGVISDNHITGNGARGECIAFSGSYMQVEGNKGSNCGSAGVMLFLAAAGENHNLIARNVVYDNAGQGIAVVWGANNLNTDDLRIEENTAFDTGGGAQHFGIQSYISMGVTGYTWSNVRIVHNVIYGNANGSQSFVAGPSAPIFAFNTTAANGTDQITTPGAVAILGASGWPTQAVNSLYVDPATGRVAIGMSGNPPSPAVPLDIVGNEQITVASPSDYEITTNGTGSGAQKSGTRFKSNGSSVGSVGFDGSNNIDIENTQSGGLIQFFTDGVIGSGTARGTIGARGWGTPTVHFANLSTASNALVVWCDTCNIVTVTPYTCTGSGTGAWAFRNPTAATWACPF